MTGGPGGAVVVVGTDVEVVLDVLVVLVVGSTAVVDVVVLELVEELDVEEEVPLVDGGASSSCSTRPGNEDGSAKVPVS